MRTLAILAALTVALVGGGNAHAAQPQMATGGVRWTTFVPQGQTEGDEAHVGFTAHADGPMGQVEVRVVRPSTGELVQRWHGTVDCYSQSGNMATVSGTVTDLLLGTSTSTGGYFIFTATDGGEGKKASGPDSFGMTRAAVPQLCATGRIVPALPNTEGNIQIHG